MITRKLLITTVWYRLNTDPADTPVRVTRFYGKTSGHQFMKALMEQHPGTVVMIDRYTQESKVYQIEEEEFIQIAKEIEKE